MEVFKDIIDFLVKNCGLPNWLATFLMSLFYSVLIIWFVFSVINWVKIKLKKNKLKKNRTLNIEKPRKETIR